MTTEKALAVQLQAKLNEAEMALAAQQEEQRRSWYYMEEKDERIAKLEADIEERREATQGLEALKDARHRVWGDIWDVIVKGWNQLMKYQEIQEQVVSAHQKLRQLDREMEGKADTTKEMLAALEHLSVQDLALIDIESRITHMRNVHKILERAALVEKTRTLSKELGRQCYDYRSRFEMCKAWPASLLLGFRGHL